VGSESAVKPKGAEVFACGAINLADKERVMIWDVDRDDAMDSGEGWVPVTVGSSKCLFPNTKKYITSVNNVNLLIRGTRRKAQIEPSKVRGESTVVGGGHDGGHRSA
jgi:hypothetical protein